MATRQKPYPVIDLFAGPGGLGEGFAKLQDEGGRARFSCVAAIERDKFAHQTLQLRHFLRHFPNNETPDDYYRYLKGDIELDELYQRHNPQLREASRTALRISLGPDSHTEVRDLINERLAGSARWALIGGPPCQAYSLVGRSRMMGNPEFEQDERHFLYREYLRTIIDHQPPIFVMENVKGLLSATVKGRPVIDRIVSDLSNPKAALRGAPNGLNYKLYSLSESECPGEEVDPRLFLVKSEQYGVPQARHRMFIVGVRSDLNIRPRRLRSQKPPTVRQTIGNLPIIRSSLSRGEDSSDRWFKEISRLSRLGIRAELNGAPYARAVASAIKVHLKDKHKRLRNRYSQRYPELNSSHPALADMHDSSLPVLTAHEARSHMPSDLHRYMYAAIFAQVNSRSPKLSDFPESLLPDHQNVELGRKGKMFSDRFRVQLPDAVSTTITSHISKDGHYFIHYDPSQCRSLTVREAARLQTFPDNYAFLGPRTAQYHQVGNAVPPHLARQIAGIIAEVLDAMKASG